MVSGGGRPARRRQLDGSLVGGLLVGGGALLLYARTLMPGLGLWDTAEFQAIGPVLGIAHPTGFPTYTLLAWLASVVLQPFGDEALRANLLSALLAAGAAGTTAGLVGRLTANPVAGVAAGVALAVAPTPWSVGLRADAHALHFFLAAILLALLAGWAHRSAEPRSADRWLLAAAIVYGIALGNHALTLLLAPGIAVFVLLVEPRLLWQRPRLVAVCAAALVVTTALLYAYLPLRSAMDPPLDYANPATTDGFLYLVLAEQFRGTFAELPPLVDALATVARETWDQLGPLAFLALIGVVEALRRRPALLALLVLWFTVTWTFSLGYVNADIDRYHLVPTMAVAVLGGIGAAALWRLVIDGASDLRLGRRARLGLAAAMAAALLVPSSAAVPLRFDDVDLSDDRSGRIWADALLERVEPGAVVISWWSYSTPLWYAQFVEGARPDVWVVDDRTILDRDLGSAGDVIDAHLGDRPLYLVRLGDDIAALEQEYVLERLDDMPVTAVYRVVDRR